MSQGYKIHDQSAAHFLTFQIVGWVDVFTRKQCRDIVIDSLKFCQKSKQLEIYAYVIMSNHVHLLARSGINDLSGTVRDFKSFTSKQIQEFTESEEESRRGWMRMVFEYHAKFKIKQTGQVWTHENHPIEVFSPQFVRQKVNYIHQNPVKAGIVAEAEDYLYSSARNYASLSSLIDVIIV